MQVINIHSTILKPIEKYRTLHFRKKFYLYQPFSLNIAILTLYSIKHILINNCGNAYYEMNKQSV